MPKKVEKKLTGFVTLRLPPTLKEALETAATEEERSLGQLIRMLLLEGLERRGGKNTVVKTTSKTKSSP